MVEHIAPLDVKKKMDNKEDFILLDVRTPGEYATAKIEGSKLIPLDQLPERLTELDKNKEIIIHCHHGNRSIHACEHLSQLGFKNVKNMAGGIEEWSNKVDSKVPKY